MMNVAEAKKYYPFFGIGANVALLVAGYVMKRASSMAKVKVAIRCSGTVCSDRQRQAAAIKRET